MMTYYQLHPWEQISVKFERKYKAFSTAKIIRKCQSARSRLMFSNLNVWTHNGTYQLSGTGLYWFIGPWMVRDYFSNSFLRIGLLSMLCEFGIRWEPHDPTYGMSTLVPGITYLMPSAASHCLSHCRPRSMSSYGVTRSKWVKISRHNVMLCFSEGIFPLIGCKNIQWDDVL